jgi:hypothetical protein
MATLIWLYGTTEVVPLTNRNYMATLIWLYGTTEVVPLTNRNYYGGADMALRHNCKSCP